MPVTMNNASNMDAACESPARDSIPELRRVVDEIAREEGWRGVEFDVTAGSKAGDNYVGVIHRVTISGEREDGKKETKSLICKTEVDSLARREHLRSDNLFRNEAVFYNDILRAYQTFQTKKGLPTSKHFSSLPSRCYHASDVLILEDMSPSGFTMRNPREPLDFDHCCLVVRALGQLHALSFALRDQDPKEFQRLTSLLQENLFVSNEVHAQLVLGYCDQFMIRALEKFKATTGLGDTRHEELLERFRKNFIPSMRQVVLAATAEPYAVINHGDCWTNNFLFQSDKESSVVQRVCMLDYQLCRFASPVTDLAYLLYTATDKRTRDRHFDQLMIEYHRSLSDFLKQLGSEPDKLFPFEALQSQWQRFGQFGLGIGVVSLPFHTSDPENIIDLDKQAGTVLDLSDNISDLCWVRMNEIIEEMVERNYLD